MGKIKRVLLENHLAFLAAHRGRVCRDGDTISVESDRTEFNYTLLGKTSEVARLPKSVQTIQHLPWSVTTPDDLERAGFTRTIGLSYMILGEDRPTWRVRNDLVIIPVDSQSQMDLFSDVQSRGFNETQESFDRWHPWLKAANDRNLRNKNQIFYVGLHKGKPAGTVLMVHEGEAAGIYAVATLPQQRKKGISATIMRQAIEDARQGGLQIITLQVKQDSYVEDFYRHLGFQRVFTAGIYRRNS